MKIRALKAFTIRNSETGDLTSIANGAIAEVSDTLGSSLISDGLAEAYDDGSNDENFKKAVDRSITNITADMLEGVTSIKISAFNSCSSLTSVEIPNSVTSIGGLAFIRCSSLTSVTVLATTPPRASTMFSGTPISVIYVPAESVETYKTASGWRGYARKIQAIPA